jgi:PAS domain S-box-containing protein
VKNNPDKLTQKTQQLKKELQQLRHALENSQHQLDNFSRKGFCETRCRNYAYVVENTPVAVVITNKNGLIEFVNPKFEEISGYKSAEVIGKNPNILKSGETDASEYAELWNIISSGKQWTGVFHNRRKNGELFWERAVIAGIRDEKGEISHFIAIKEDITALRQANKKLEHERLKIIQQSKMAEIGLLASGILHEVGNPIAAIRGLICDIKDSCEQTDTSQEALYKRVDQQLAQVLSEVDRITGITMDISEFTYSHHSKVELQDINALINTTCRLIQYDKRWSNIDLRVILDAELPAINFIKDQMAQVLINLISNAAYAVEHETSKQSTIHVSTYHDDENIFIVIKDNGCGIDQKNLPKIFDSFFTSKAPGEGSGLGLAICKSIIDDHHGSIKINSRVGTATEVCLSLPVETGQSS